ncbi:MAG: DUF456 domain-containing protein [Bacteroidales bacterium]|nr:DUF456 domain-containing protein [Bacteroidales bacterium]
MAVLIAIVAILAGLFGIIGSIVPALPGPPVSWLGMLALYFWGGNVFDRDMPLWLLLLMLGITILVTILDYTVPARLTKTTGGSRYASRGSIVGMILGMFLTPIGMILGGLLGAFLCEFLFGGKSAGESLKASMGTFLGFLAGTGLKLLSSCTMMWLIILYL